MGLLALVGSEIECLSALCCILFYSHSLALLGTFPYNAFLSGFATSCGMFCNVANLRIQLHPKNADQVFVSPER